MSDIGKKIRIERLMNRESRNMGRLGKHTRVIAPFYGSVLTYAAVDSEVSAAPGQFQVDEIKKILELLE
jgi:3-dehydroquinate dehydratase